MREMGQIEVVAPILKRRLSRVIATVVQLVPLMANEMCVVATGPGLPCIFRTFRRSAPLFCRVIGGVSGMRAGTPKCSLV